MAKAYSLPVTCYSEHAKKIENALLGSLEQASRLKARKVLFDIEATAAPQHYRYLPGTSQEISATSHMYSVEDSKVENYAKSIVDDREQLFFKRLIYQKAISELQLDGQRL